ncbi:MAG: hypothetical protein ABIO94_03945 [Opitutaceae bacterium]
MKRTKRFLPWITASLVVLVLLLMFHHQRLRHRLLEDERERLAGQASWLRHTLETTRKSGDQLSQKVQSAELAAEEPALSPAGRRRSDLATKLTEIKATAEKRLPPPLVPASRRGDIFSELMEDRTYAERVKDLFELQVESNYGPWLRTLMVSSDARAQVMKLLVEQYLVELDAEEAAVHAGLDLDKNRREVTQLRTKIAQALLAELQGVLGDAGYANFLAYHATVPFRTSLASAIGRRLSYSDEPLTAEQTNRIVALTLAPSPTSERLKLGLETHTGAVLAQARLAFTPAQWDQVQEYRRDTGAVSTTPAP